MFKKILIANRGEIAVRIIRACRDMQIISVAVYSLADADALHTQLADESVCIGPAETKESYLNMQSILSAAIAKGADAIHPGFGFLSENAQFADLCRKCGISFIGPLPEAITLMGDKAKACQTVKKIGAPVIPGSNGTLASLDEAYELASQIGYPILLKAAAGGGGRGIRLVENRDSLENAYLTAKTEAASFFGDDSMYMEKFLTSPRHVEIQVLADHHGNIVHLFERDCSVQRRNQKLIEESPSEFLSPELRDKMGETAVKIARYVGYRNAGTIEFLVDKNQNYYFMEMNTRIQVEHPVTEMITGQDLVVWQIKIAAGQRLNFEQKDLRINGHAIECRINAEDVRRNFMPCPGEITSMNVPGGPGVRIDSAVYQGYNIPRYYDSMITKLIVHGSSRNQAIVRMKRALGEMHFEGISTNIDYHLAILDNENFISGNYGVDFIQKNKLVLDRI